MKWLLLCIVFAIASVSAHAQSKLLQAHAATGGCTGYTGPGNVLSGATFYYGLPAYDCTAANGTHKLYNVRRQSDNVQCDLLIATSGIVAGNTTATCNSSTQGNVSALTFAGVDATGTGSITGATLTFTGGHQWDEVTGAGVPAGTFIVSGSSPTWGLNNNLGTPTGSVSMTLTWGLFITQAYDQSGNANDTPVATSGHEPQFLATGDKTLSCQPMNFIISPTQSLVGSLTSVANPFTFLATARAFATGSGITQVILETNNGGGAAALYVQIGPDQITEFSGSEYKTNFAADNLWHTNIGVLAGAGSVITQDGVDSSPTGNPGTNASGTTIFIGQDVSNGLYWLGPMAQVGMWPSEISSGNRVSINSNIHTNCGF